MAETSEAAQFSYKPLYVQVKDRLVRRLIDGAWQPGQLIPSEMELAREIGVSQGTIRKALDAMSSEHLLVRRQGRGTYVAELEESRILFRYFRIVPDGGAHSFPTSRIMTRATRTPTAAEREKLDLEPQDQVVRIERIREIDSVPAIIETISLSRGRFAGLDSIDAIPNNVYRLYSEKWGITIAKASERLKAISADATDAGHLGCAPGAPLLEINRVAYDLENRPVELRLSRCLTERLHYSSELR
jgi:GntR family transcriptional regulator